MEYILILFFFFFTYYLGFILLNIYGLLYQKKSPYQETANLSISVIIAIRNGQNSINNLIQDLLKQDYDGPLEFILVDDDSNDQTKNIIKEAEFNHPKIKYVSSNSGESNLKFKKKALDAGIKQAKYDILLFTDVDCRLGKLWVKSMSSYFYNDIDYVIGFSRAPYEFGFANLFQRIDFLMLMFSAKSVTNIGVPLACSGQNQAYRKSLFQKVGGYKKISHLLMGDDSIFLQLCLKHKAKAIFCSDPNSYVFCRPEKTWKSLFFQRARWAGDGNIMWRFNISFYMIMIATVISNIFFFFLISTCSFRLFFILLISKFIAELALAIVGLERFKEKISVSSFVYWYFLNIPYICIMSIASFFVSFFSWKNRSQ